MDNFNEIKKSFGEIQLASFERETNEAIELRAESTKLLDLTFTSDVAMQESAEQFMELLVRLKEFELRVVNFPIMLFMYSDIARVALHSFNFEDAILYAKAGIVANGKYEDHEGVLANARVLLDMSCMIGAMAEAKKLLNQYPALGNDEIYSIVNSRPSKHDDVVRKGLESPSQPLSLEFCIDEGAAKREGALRALMSMMGISRATALEYEKAALHMRGEK